MVLFCLYCVSVLPFQLYVYVCAVSWVKKQRIDVEELNWNETYWLM